MAKPSEYKIYLILILITMSLPCVLCAQIRLSYSIGGIGGSTVNTASSAKTATYSSPMVLSGTKCYTVTNSIAKFSPTNSGAFFTACDVTPQYIKINIKVFPNPATNYTVIQFLNKLEFDNKFNVTLFSEVGQLVQRLEVTQDQLLNGYRFDLTSFANGLYFLQVSSSQILQTYKIIKS